MNELTLCSVYHSSPSKHFLELNRDLTESLNARRDFSWIAVDNTPHDFKEEKLDSTRFRILRGVPLAEYQKTLEPWQEGFKTSMHVGYALNMALKQVDTRFAVILDGDFYIVRQEWMTEVISHMKKHNLALMGVPWHPRWFKKTRYFPTLHALFIDARQIPPASLDFRPRYEAPDELPFEKQRMTNGRTTPSFLDAIKNNIRMRRYVNSSKDCAHALYERYQKSAFRFETFTPVFKPYARDGSFERFIKLWIDTLLPDRYSLTPRLGTYTKKGFKERGYFDARGYDWEEFMWQDKPFGFHMRNTGNAKRNKDEDLKVVEQAVADFKSHPVV